MDYLFASRHKGPRFKSPGGYLCETGILLFRLLPHWWPRRDWSDVSLHWWPQRDWSSLWPRLRRASSRTVTRPSYRQCDNPTWSHTAFLSLFYARCRSSFWLHNRHSRLLGGSPVESLQSHFILTMSHWSSGLPICFPSQGTQVQITRGVLMWNWDSPVSDVSLQALFWFIICEGMPEDRCSWISCSPPLPWRCDVRTRTPHIDVIKFDQPPCPSST